MVIGSIIQSPDGRFVAGCGQSRRWCSPPCSSPLSWVTVLTAVLMLLIWLDLGSRSSGDDDDII